MSHPKSLDDEIPELGVAEPAETWQWQDVELAPAVATTPVLAKETLPPERVRFAAPLHVRLADSEEESEGAVLNLSESGAACVLPLVLSVGERLWIRFRVELADEPVCILAEVAWRRATPDARSIYGLRFVDVDDGDAERIVETVRERTEGRAGEWPLPVVPAARVTRGPRPVVTGMLGLAAGVLLALVASMVPRTGFAPASAKTAVNPEVAEAEAVPQSGASALAEPSDNGAAQQDATATQDAPAGEANATGSPSVAASEAKSSNDKRDSIDAPAAVPDADVSASEAAAQKPAEASDAEQSWLVPTREGADVRLVTRDPVGEFRTFWLQGPRRLVVDVTGTASALARSEYVVDHPLVKRLRVGTYHDKVRFVLETTDAVAAEVQARAEGSVLYLHLAGH